MCVYELHFFTHKDSDVAHEKIRIDAADTNDDLIQIKNLKKVSVYFSFLLRA